MADVEDFAREKDLTDMLPLLQRGALVAQNPKQFEHIEGLTSEEVEGLRFERQHKWKHPLALYSTIILCSIGAAVQYGLSSAHRNPVTNCFTGAGTKLDPMAQICRSLRNSASVLVRQQEIPIRTVTTGSSA